MPGAESNVNVLVTAENTAEGPLADLSAQLTALTEQMAELNTQMGAMGDKMLKSNTNSKSSWDSMAASIKSTGKELTDLGGKFNMFLTLPILAAGAASVVLATNFEQSMMRVSTLAQVPKAQIAGLSDQILQLAGQVGFSPDSLAEAFYHTESQFAGMGLTGQQAINMLKVAAEGAKIGGADLVDVTNALGAAVVAGIPGVKNYSEAMGALNATVGAGDMTMQNLAEALGTGVLAVIKGYGATIQDASAALATFGDNNIRGAAAGTQLRMSVQALTVPTKQGKDNLEALGMTSNQLAKDMQSGGLNKALVDLTDHLGKAGITGTQTGEWLTESFGKRAGVGVSILMDQLDRFQGKYKEAVKGATQMDSEWAQQQTTAKQKFDDFKGSLEALGVKLGNALLPPLTQFVGWLQTMVEKFEKLSPGQKKMLEFVALFALFIGPIMTAIGAVLGFVAAVMTIGVPVAVAIGIVLALAAAGAALITWWKPITGFFGALWKDVVNFSNSGVGQTMSIMFPFIGIPLQIITHFQQIGAFFGNLWNEITGHSSQGAGSTKASWESLLSVPIRIISAFNPLLGFFTTLAGAVAHSMGGVAGIRTDLHNLHVPGFANGVTNFGGGLAITGENGPEIGYWPSGTNIIPAGPTQAILSGGGGNNAGMSGGNTTSVQIQQVVLQTAAAVDRFFSQLDQDAINVGKGLTPTRGHS